MFASILRPVVSIAGLTSALAPTAVAQRSGSLDAGARPISAFSSQRLARIDSALTALTGQRKLPGVVAMIVKDGRVVYHKAFGVRDLDTNAPQRTDDIFRIFSQTKAVTSVAAMMLWEEGKFGLDDPIGKFIPEFDKQNVLTTFNPADSSYESKPVRRRATIRQLFTHSAGLTYGFTSAFAAIYAKAGISALGREGDLLGERMRALGKLPLAYEPGEQYSYSISIDLLGHLVEIWSGMPLDRFFRTRIFEPLKMPDTWFELPREKHARLVTLHQERDGVVTTMRTPTDGLYPDSPVRAMTFFSGGGGLSSTTTDYARFLQMVLNGGELDGVRLLSPKTVELMLKDHIPNLEMEHGLGFALETAANDHRSVISEGSYHWSGAANTWYWVDPKERLIGLVYANVYPSTVRLGDLFKTLVYAAMQ